MVTRTSIPVPSRTLSLRDVEVLDAQARHQPQAGAVEELRHQSAGAREVVENAAHVLFGEDGGQAFGLLGVPGGNRASAPYATPRGRGTEKR